MPAPRYSIFNRPDTLSDAQPTNSIKALKAKTGAMQQSQKDDEEKIHTVSKVCSKEAHPALSSNQIS